MGKKDRNREPKGKTKRINSKTKQNKTKQNRPVSAPCPFSLMVLFQF